MILFALAALSGVLQVLVFPRFSIVYLAVVAVTPLLYGVAKAPGWRRRFLLGWLAGAIYWGGSCYWVFPVMGEYAGINAPAAALIFLLFFLAKGLHLGVFAIAAGPLLRRPWAIPAVAALWVAIEGGHQYLGFTWLQLGNAAASMTLLAPLARSAGVYGPSFVLAMLNVALYLVWERRPRRELVWLAVLPLLLLLPRLPDGEVGDRAVRLVQPNIHPDQVRTGWSSANQNDHMRRMLELSTTVAEAIDPTPPELLVWPEYSVPAYYFDSPASKMYLESVARAVGAPFVFNTLSFVEINGERRPQNSAVTLAADGRLLSRYSKRFLVPFGEFVPWPFSLVVHKITLAAGDFYPGQEATVAALGEHKLGTYICYETAFGRGVRDVTAAGAEVLVNISNDGWYGRTAARDQHLLLTRMRAIENQRWILRATADGITTVVNRAGQIVEPLPSFQDGVLPAYFSYAGETTLYVRLGEWFWWLSLAVTMFALAWTRPKLSARSPRSAFDARINRLP